MYFPYFITSGIRMLTAGVTKYDNKNTGWTTGNRFPSGDK